MGIDLDDLIEKVKKCDYLLEDELKALCDYVSIHCTENERCAYLLSNLIK